MIGQGNFGGTLKVQEKLENLKLMPTTVLRNSSYSVE